MISNAFWVFLVALLAVFARSGSALRCWDCASNMNAMCGDPMNTTEHQAMFHVRECTRGSYPTPKPICRKIVKREGGERVVIRSCAAPNQDETDTTDGPCSPLMTNGRDMIESCHICNTDLCNSASDPSTIRSLYVAGLLLIGYGYFASKYARVL